MIITGMKIENYKNIELVELVPDEHMNLVSGTNGAGKTSLIEAIIDAIKGKTEIGKSPQRKIKRGASKAVIEVTLGDGDSSLSIKRTITDKGVYLKAERSDGNPVSQTDLDGLLDSSTINITKLLHLNPKDQVEFVKKIAGIDTNKVEEDYREKYAERTILNRAMKEADSVVNSYGEVEQVNHIDVSNLINKIEEGRQHNLLIKERMSEIESLNEKINTNSIHIENDLDRIAQAEATIKQIKDNISNYNNSIKETKKELSIIESKSIEKEIDVSSLLSKVEDSEAINSKAREYNVFISKKDIYKAAKAKVTDVNMEMTALLSERENIISSSKLPFKNVEFDKELGLIVNGIAFTEMSSAEQIRMMARIYIESNPELRVIYIKDGSLLDSETMKSILDMSELNDYQFLVEVVEETEGSIIMREGSIYDSTAKEAVSEDGQIEL